MASSGAKVKNIDEIKDVLEMIQVMAALSIPCQGYTNLDDMKKRVKDELAKSPSLSAGEVSWISTEHKFSDQCEILLKHWPWWRFIECIPLLF